MQIVIVNKNMIENLRDKILDMIAIVMYFDSTSYCLAEMNNLGGCQDGW